MTAWERTFCGSLATWPGDPEGGGFLRVKKLTCKKRKMAYQPIAAIHHFDLLEFSVMVLVWYLMSSRWGCISKLRALNSRFPDPNPPNPSISKMFSENNEKSPDFLDLNSSISSGTGGPRANPKKVVEGRWKLEFILSCSLRWIAISGDLWWFFLLVFGVVGDGETRWSPAFYIIYIYHIDKLMQYTRI